MGLCHAFGLIDADEFAITQHRDAGGDLQHLGKAVADKDDSHTIVRELSHDVEQLVRLGLGERGGWLIHKDETCIIHQSAGDGDNLALGDGQLLKRHAKIQLHAKALQDSGGPLAH